MRHELKRNITVRWAPAARFATACVEQCRRRRPVARPPGNSQIGLGARTDDAVARMKTKRRTNTVRCKARKDR